MSGPGAHSPVGASSIKRALACPASVSLAVGIEDEESDAAALGTAVHALIEHCLVDNRDAWEYVGADLTGMLIDKKMAISAQVMLDAVRKAHPERNQGNFWVERRFHCPTIHHLFYGTSDVVHWDEDTATLHVWDYKNGFLTVEHVENAQGMYYACGALEDLDLWTLARNVVIHIVQPNGFHHEGPVRSWETTTEYLVEWLEDKLVPGIEEATSPALLKQTNSGEHCRWCPARSHACPQLMSDMDELEELMEQAKTQGADALTGEQLARLLELTETAKIVGKAAQSTAFKRIQAGTRIDGWKLAKAKAFREWKEEAAEAAKAEFGEQAYTEPKLKSPAQIDELPKGSAFTSRWAFKPDTGLTLVRGTDSRPEVSTDTKSLFSPVVVEKSAPVAEAIPAPAAGRRKKPALSLVEA